MGCKAGDLELILYLICVGLEDKFWEDSWEAVERSLHLQKVSRITKDADVLLSLMDYYSGDVLYDLEDAYHKLCMAEIKERHADKKKLASNLYPRCYLPVLVAYVRGVTGKYYFSHLAALVRCGCKPDDPNGGYSSDAVRQAFNRFCEEYPLAWDRLEKAVDEWRHGFRDSPFVVPNELD